VVLKRKARARYADLLAAIHGGSDDDGSDDGDGSGNDDGGSDSSNGDDGDDGESSDDWEGPAAKEERAKRREAQRKARRSAKKGGKKETKDIEITFEPGLVNLGQAVLDRRAAREMEANETVWEKVLR
jgi:hypothetical protein